MKSIFLVLMAPIIGTVGQIFLKFGMRQVGQITLFELKNNTLSVLLSILSNPWILLAIPLYVGGFIFWLIILSKFNLSFAYPFLALSFVMVPLLSLLILGEHISILRWTGIIVILLGIVIIGFSK
jgi:multidrug transporter EmrE-like cation transporter